MTARLALAVTTCMLLFVAGCSTDKPKPTPLETVCAQDRRPPPAWTARVGNVSFPIGRDGARRVSSSWPATMVK
jgi:hypothetical protein